MTALGFQEGMLGAQAPANDVAAPMPSRMDAISQGTAAAAGAASSGGGIQLTIQNLNVSADGGATSSQNRAAAREHATMIVASLNDQLEDIAYETGT
jgi:hypothetical protein